MPIDDPDLRTESGRRRQQEDDQEVDPQEQDPPPDEDEPTRRRREDSRIPTAEERRVYQEKARAALRDETVMLAEARLRDAKSKDPSGA